MLFLAVWAPRKRRASLVTSASHSWELFQCGFLLPPAFRHSVCVLVAFGTQYLWHLGLGFKI